MPDENEMTPANLEMEAALGTLVPSGRAASRVDPIAAAFEAGKRSQRGRVHRWQTFAGLILLIGIAPWLIPNSNRHEPSAGRMEIGPIALNAPATSLPKHEPLSDQSLLALETVIREKGVAGLPPARLPRVGPLSPF